MQDAKTYHQYAADCRRMASTMNANDRKILLKMADAWDERAKEAERLERLVQTTERKPIRFVSPRNQEPGRF